MLTRPHRIKETDFEGEFWPRLYRHSSKQFRWSAWGNITYHERTVARMGSLRGIHGQSIKEKNRIRALVRRGVGLSKMTEEDFLWTVDALIRTNPTKLPDPGGDRSQTELALQLACSVWEAHREAESELRELFGLPEYRFLNSPLFYPNKILERAKKHGCVGCEWQDDGLCIGSEGEDAIPAECPGFENRRTRGT